jgi:hypothetical protein
MTNERTVEQSLTAKNERMIDGITVEQWLAIREEAGLKIDPETAEVASWFTQVGDPYGVYPEPPEEYQCVGRAYFACAPGTKIWVEFDDLPEAISDALMKKLIRSAWSTSTDDDIPY